MSMESSARSSAVTEPMKPRSEYFDVAEDHVEMALVDGHVHRLADR